MQVIRIARDNIRLFDDLFEASYRQEAGAGHLFMMLGATWHRHPHDNPAPP